MMAHLDVEVGNHMGHNHQSCTDYMGWAHSGHAISQFGYGAGLQGQYGVYPAPGTRPLSAHSPYSPYNFGGYDPYGYPLPHPGVPSSTPVPAGEAKAAEKKEEKKN